MSSLKIQPKKTFVVAGQEFPTRAAAKTFITETAQREIAASAINRGGIPDALKAVPVDVLIGFFLTTQAALKKKGRARSASAKPSAAPKPAKTPKAPKAAKTPKAPRKKAVAGAASAKTSHSTAAVLPPPPPLPAG